MGSFRRLVYSPTAWAFVKTQKHDIVNLSDFIVAGDVNRVVNEISTANVTIRNSPMSVLGVQSHYGRFTVNPQAQLGDDDAEPWFHPMDPITVYLSRFPDRPVQVFTGFLDKTPYVQLFPGTITLQASCTLKRLMYTFWDPALPFTRDFLAQFGWLSDVSSGQLINFNATEKQLDPKNPNPHLTDSGFGDLLYAVLNRIGGWREDQLHIEQLPPGLIDTVAGIYNAFVAENADAEQQFSELLSRIIGSNGAGTAGGNTSPSSFGTLGGLKFTGGQQTFATTLAPLLNYDIRVIGAWMYSEENGAAATSRETSNNHDWLNINTGSGFVLPSPVAGDPARGAKYTYDWITGKTNPHGDPQTIKASLLAASGKGPQAQLQAIVDSNWEGHHYAGIGGLAGLRKLYDQISVKQTPADVGRGGGSGGQQLPPKQQSGHGHQGTGQYSALSLPIPSHFIPLKQSGPSFGRLDQGVDIEGYSIGKPIYAIWSGTVHYGHNPGPGVFGSANPDGRYPILRFDKPLPISQFANYNAIYYGHCKVNPALREGDSVQVGDVIAYGGFAHAGGGGHMELGFGDPTTGIAKLGSGAALSAATDMFNFLKAMVTGNALDPTDTGNTTGTNNGTILPTATAAAFATSIEFPGLEETVEAVALQGQKSLMNDKPLLPFIQQLAGASLRHFMSLPNGSLIAFYPDFFGTYNHRAPYWSIEDIEIIDGKIELTDDALATHVFVVGDTFPFIGGPSELVNKLASGGVVNIFNAFKAGDWMIEGGKSALGQATDIPTVKGKKGQGKNPKNINSPTSVFGNTGKALAFLQKFGARPLYQEEPFIRSPYFEAFMAFTLFQLAWSKQFLTTFQLTFMPELYPGGRVRFPRHGFACYIDSVSHTWDYTSGFSTTVNFSAPSAYTAPGDSPSIEHNPIAQGMIRAI